VLVHIGAKLPRNADIPMNFPILANLRVARNVGLRTSHSVPTNVMVPTMVEFTQCRSNRRAGFLLLAAVMGELGWPQR
jgi:hypothetical protein